MSGGTPGPGGLFGRPEALAAAAAGACSAVFALWAMRGLPLGGLLLWAAPLPIFAAGFGFGARSAAYATAVSAAVVVLTSSFLGFVIHLALFSLPAVLIVALAGRGSELELSRPLALLGIWPVLLLLVLAVTIPDLEAEMREAVEQGVQRMGVPMPDTMVAQIAQVKAAAAGFWLALLMLANGWAGYRLAASQGLSPPAVADAADLRLPSWYLPLPLVAGAAWLAFGGAVALSSMLLLLVPLFLMGVVAVHLRLRGRPARKAFLAGFYVLMLLFLQVMAPLMVGLGLFEQYRRRATPPPT
jgi:hypothetical protein